MAVTIAVARDPVEPPFRHRRALPHDLEHVILRCPANSPADRYPGADALDRALAGCAAARDFARAAAWWDSQGRLTTASAG
jgi:eukaryotic-like serine/threonine-protein kinase